jgi:threonine dehydrogenase-like Zn-dependent dehydrogenase
MPMAIAVTSADLVLPGTDQQTPGAHVLSSPERQDFEEAVSLLADGVMPAESLITDVVPLSETEGAFERLASGEEIVKLLIDSR